MQLHGTLLTLFPWEICMVMYIKKKKETSHDIQSGKWRGLFATLGKRASHVSSFATNMKPPKQLLFLTGFFRLLSQETWAFVADFTLR